MCPALALYCTVHFHLSTIGQSSFQEFTKCHTSRTLPTKPRFDVPSYLERNKLHENRRAYFDGLVLRLANPPASGMVWGSHNMTELHVLHAQIFLPYRLWSWDAQSDTSQIGTPLCEQCPRNSCSFQKLRWSEYFIQDIFKWRREANAEESRYPGLVLLNSIRHRASA